MENIENSFEQTSRKFIYRDNFQDRKVIFECEAMNITEADEKYKQVIGQDVSKQPHIACAIESTD